MVLFASTAYRGEANEPRVTVNLPRTFRCRVCALAETARKISGPCNGGSDGYTNRDGSHRRYPAQFRCEECGCALEGRGTLQGVDRRRLYRGGSYLVGRASREARVWSQCRRDSVFSAARRRLTSMSGQLLRKANERLRLFLSECGRRARF